ncbi:MAG: hypothetical protein PHU06_09680 [Gallionella sp.]|nr:hypothetical protein [Gallionella sp.]MDD4959190.1 hypothetical protein [Gallionella sp.]
MNKFITMCMLAICLLCFGCTNEDENFIGIWSNKVAGNLGDIQLTISRDGKNLLVKESIISNGNVIAMRSAKVKDGYLLIDGDVLYAKMSYSKTEDALIPINTGESILGALPGFHRIK